jgi:two-component system nitrate/nitrite response regulator NarL
MARGRTSLAASAPGMALSARQRETLALAARGLPNKLIARHLGVEVTTVRKHLAAAYIRLGVADRVQAAKTAGVCDG